MTNEYSLEIPRDKKNQISFLLMAVFAEIVVFRTLLYSRIKYGFRALFLMQKDKALNKNLCFKRKNPSADFYFLSNIKNQPADFSQQQSLRKEPKSSRGKIK